MMESFDFDGRIARLQDALGSRDVNVALLLDPRSQYYLTGIGVKGAVIVPVESEPVHLVQLNYERAAKESGIADVRPSRGMKTIGEVIDERTDTNGAVVGIETDVLPVQTAEDVEEVISSAQSLVPVQDILLEHRRRKSEAELERLERAAEISNETLTSVSDAYEEDIMEIELKSKLQRIKRGAGADDGMWSRTWDQYLDFGILVSGPNTAVISGHWVTMTGQGPSSAQPWGAGKRRIRDEDVIIVDHGTVFEGYHADEARTYVVGQPTDRQRDAHEILLAAMEAAEDAIQPGEPMSAIYDAAYEVVSETPYAEQFMGLDQVGFEYLGHQVGLTIDEFPLITPWEDTEIREGMVFALEPKIMWEGEGGVDLEDTVVATANGTRRLTKTPREIIRI